MPYPLDTPLHYAPDFTQLPEYPPWGEKDPELLLPHHQQRSVFELPELLFVTVSHIEQRRKSKKEDDEPEDVIVEFGVSGI